MKNSGVTRKIDELGRIVLPKEMRRMLSIRDGENIEIVLEDDKIVLKKYNYIKNVSELGKELINIYNSVSNNNIIITDREKVVASNNDEKLINKLIDHNLLKLIDNRESLFETKTIRFDVESITANFIVMPIINDIDCVGLVIIYNENEELLLEEKVLAKFISKIIANKLNIS